MNYILDLGENDIKLENKYLNYQDNTNINTNDIYNQLWIEKYRPDKFDDIISHNDILNALQKMINNNSFPHIIFYGPSGTGKTTTILTCAKNMYGDNYKKMILELNGSEDRGINIVREQIKEFSMSKQFINNNITNINFKLVILDEADSMTYDAQFALRRVIENYSNNTRFCLICNYENKIITALKSRCMIFRFSPIPKEIHFNKLKNICKLENIDIVDKGLNIIISLSDGDMRKSINLLQSLNTALKKKILVKDIYKQIKYPSLKQKNNIIKIIFDKNIILNEAIAKINNYRLLYNISINDILIDISKFLIKNSNNYNIINIFDKLGNIEIYLSNCSNEQLILASIISIIKLN
jgi:replication factor C subunit 3/5